MKLSVCVTTYNQVEYIGKTIEHILSQKTNFDYEIIIGDDYSTDGTREVLINYKNKFPELIKLNLHTSKNEGIPGKLNFVSTINSSVGKYIALCDGDDYWIDDDKLQMQVEFLDNNPDFVICFHSMEFKYEGIISKVAEQNFLPLEKEIFTIEDLARGNFIYTSSCTFRRNAFGELPEWFFKIKAGDYVLHLLNSQYGKIKYIDRQMGVYRLHSQSFWSSQDQVSIWINWVEVQEVLIGKFSKKVNEILAESQVEILYKLFQYFENQGDAEKAYAYLNRIMQRKPDFMYKRHVQALQYQQALLDSQSYKLGHLLLQPLRILKKKQP